MDLYFRLVLQKLVLKLDSQDRFLPVAFFLRGAFLYIVSLSVPKDWSLGYFDSNYLLLISAILLGIASFYLSSNMVLNSDHKIFLLKILKAMLVFVVVMPLLIGVPLTLLCIDLLLKTGYKPSLLSITLIYLFFMLVPQMALMILEFRKKDEKRLRFIKMSVEGVSAFFLIAGFFLKYAFNIDADLSRILSETAFIKEFIQQKPLEKMSDNIILYMVTPLSFLGLCIKYFCEYRLLILSNQKK
ncbi:hypothetical protein [Paenibacillus elgii]|nr:hypothetical protein [Paenibacillus elgii]